MIKKPLCTHSAYLCSASRATFFPSMFVDSWRRIYHRPRVFSPKILRPYRKLSMPVRLLKTQRASVQVICAPCLGQIDRGNAIERFKLQTCCDYLYACTAISPTSGPSACSKMAMKIPIPWVRLIGAKVLTLEVVLGTSAFGLRCFS